LAEGVRHDNKETKNDVFLGKGADEKPSSRLGKRIGDGPSALNLNARWVGLSTKRNGTPGKDEKRKIFPLRSQARIVKYAECGAPEDQKKHLGKKVRGNQLSDEEEKGGKGGGFSQTPGKGRCHLFCKKDRKAAGPKNKEERRKAN